MMSNNIQCKNTTLQNQISTFENALKGLSNSKNLKIIPCREEEVRSIYQFVSRCMTSRQSGIVLLNGSPGTGKTLCVEFVLASLVMNHCQKFSVKNDTVSQNNENDSQINGRKTKININKNVESSNISSDGSEPILMNNNILRINGFSFTNGFEIFERVGKFVGMSLKEVTTFKKIAVTDGIEPVIKKIVEQCQRNENKNMRVICIDEVDQLIETSKKKTFIESAWYKTRSMSQRRVATRHENSLNSTEIVRHFFNLVSIENIGFVTIAISNTSDIEMFLPKNTRKRNNLRLILQFKPYVASNLKTIVKSRLNSVGINLVNENNKNCVFDTAALELCIKKIVDANGDCRRVLNACKRMIQTKLLQTRNMLNLNLTREAEIDKFVSYKKNENFRKRRQIIGVPATLDWDEKFALTNTLVLENETDESTVASHAISSPSLEDEVSISPELEVDLYDTSYCENSSHFGLCTVQDAMDAIQCNLQNERQRNLELLRGLTTTQQQLLLSICLNVYKKSNDTENNHKNIELFNCKNNLSLSFAELQFEYVELCDHYNLPSCGNGASFLLEALESLESSGFISISATLSNRNTTRKRMTTPHNLRKPTKNLDAVYKNFELLLDTIETFRLFQCLGSAYEGILMRERITI